ncbi:hypothetical protein Scep_022306 [Stephania cephalantha]|uniref:Uncharacterized protein n=1 Tax=Stephania cephalantha TaxID=152367 RepID=A0AAP0I0V5_9MAGN
MPKVMCRFGCSVRFLEGETFWAVKEATKLQSELQLLEKQSALSDKHAEYVNEAVQLFEENSLPDMFQRCRRPQPSCVKKTRISGLKELQKFDKTK